MYKLFFSSILLNTIFSLNLSVSAQSLPRLRKGMLYEQARNTLTRQGWRAVVNSEQVNNPNRSGIISYLITKRGYTEVVDCSGTGLGLCLFQFRNATGQTLFISTADNEPPAKSTVFAWRVENSAD